MEATEKTALDKFVEYLGSVSSSQKIWAKGYWLTKLHFSLNLADIRQIFRYKAWLRQFSCKYDLTEIHYVQHFSNVLSVWRAMGFDQVPWLFWDRDTEILGSSLPYAICFVLFTQSLILCTGHQELVVTVLQVLSWRQVFFSLLGWNWGREVL